MAYMMNRGNGQVPAQMAVRWDRYRSTDPVPMTIEEVAHAVATGCTCHECTAPRQMRPQPVSVPEAGVRVRGGISRASVKLVRPTDPAPFADVWGDAR